MQIFHKLFPFLNIEELIEYFTFFGGLEGEVRLDPFVGVEKNIETEILDRFSEISDSLSPSYITENPYRKLLIATARGDGKLFTILKRAKINESAGGEVVSELTRAGIVRVEESREAPLPRLKGEQLPKELRRYRIQPKVRFVHPFHRFWFGFVEPFRAELSHGKKDRFWSNFKEHKDRAQSLIFEQLSNDLLVKIYKDTDPIISYGSWWDMSSEYDLLSFTKSGKVILGECKYKGRKITKAELTKLKEKARLSGLKVDQYVLFSRGGFSRELKEMRDNDLLLKGIEDFGELLQ